MRAYQYGVQALATHSRWKCVSSTQTLPPESHWPDWRTPSAHSAKIKSSDLQTPSVFDRPRYNIFPPPFY